MKNALPSATPTLARNVFSSINAKVLYLVSRFCLPPIIMANISLEQYGLWSLCFILIAYLGMGAFGVSNVYIRYVAQYHAAGHTDRIGSLLSTGVTLVSGFALVTLVCLWFGLPLLFTVFAVPAALHAQAFTLVFGCVAVFMLDLSWGAFTYVLAGLQQSVQQNRIWIASFLLETLLIVVFLSIGVGVEGLLYAFAIRYALSISLSVWMCFRNLPGLRLSPLLFNREHLALFVNFGGVMQVSGLLGMFLRSVEKLIAGMFLGVTAAGLFDIAQKFPIMVTSIPSSMNAVFLPAATRLHVQGKQEEFLGLYLRGARQINLVTGFMMGFLAAFAAPLLTAWLGVSDEFATAPFILGCFTLPYQFNVLTGPASNVFRSIGRPAHELFYPLLQLLLVALLVGVGCWQAGVSNQVITVAVALAMIISAVAYCVYTNHYLQISQREFVRQVMLPGLLPYLTGFLLYWLLQPWVQAAANDRSAAIVLIVAAGLLYVALQAVACWALVLADSEKRFIGDKLHALRAAVPVLRKVTA